MMHTVIGIDGGGSKTAGCIGSGQDKIIARSVSGGINQYAYSKDVIVKHLLELIDDLLEKSGKAEEDVDLIVIATAGVDSREDQKTFRSIYELCGYKMPLLLTNDAHVLMKGNFKERSGMVLISGTGSIALGQYGDEMFRFGGHGHLIGDEGSGYDIAINGIKKAFELYDKGMKSKLMSALLEESGFENPMAFRKWLYSGLGKKDIAKFAKVISDLAESGDIKAELVLMCAADDLVLLMQSLYERMKSERCKPELFMCSGSVLMNNESVREVVAEAVFDRTDMDIIEDTLEAEVCALMEGLNSLNE